VYCLVRAPFAGLVSHRNRIGGAAHPHSPAHREPGPCSSGPRCSRRWR